jgi:hypothetical protein
MSESYPKRIAHGHYKEMGSRKGEKEETGKCMHLIFLRVSFLSLCTLCLHYVSMDQSASGSGGSGFFQFLLLLKVTLILSSGLLILLVL